MLGLSGGLYEEALPPSQARLVRKQTGLSVYAWDNYYLRLPCDVPRIHSRTLTPARPTYLPCYLTGVSYLSL